MILSAPNLFGAAQFRLQLMRHVRTPFALVRARSSASALVVVSCFLLCRPVCGLFAFSSAASVLCAFVVVYALRRLHIRCIVDI